MYRKYCHYIHQWGTWCYFHFVTLKILLKQYIVYMYAKLGQICHFYCWLILKWRTKLFNIGKCPWPLTPKTINQLRHYPETWKRPVKITCTHLGRQETTIYMKLVSISTNITIQFLCSNGYLIEHFSTSKILACDVYHMAYPNEPVKKRGDVIIIRSIILWDIICIIKK